MSTKGIGRAKAKSKGKVIGWRKLSGIIKAKGHALPASPSYLKLKKAMSDDSMMIELFKEWMRDYDSSYDTKEEEEKRFWLFKDHAQEVLDHYKRGKIWEMNGFVGMAPHSDSDIDILSARVSLLLSPV